VTLGGSLTSFVSYGNENLFPSFLYRNHGMSIADIGLVLSLVAGVSGAVGTVAGGVIADKLTVRDVRWHAWTPIIGGLIAFVPYFYVLSSDNTTSILVVLFFIMIANSLYLGPSIAGVSCDGAPAHPCPNVRRFIFYLEYDRSRTWPISYRAGQRPVITDLRRRQSASCDVNHGLRRRHRAVHVLHGIKASNQGSERESR
jgi:hypothetical protein